MVFAIAALFLNLTPGMPAAEAASADRAFNAEPDTTTSLKAPASTSVADRTTTDTNSSNAAQFNLDKVSLTNASSGNAAPKLTAVSMGSSDNTQALSTIRVPELNPPPLHLPLEYGRNHFSLPASSARCTNPDCPKNPDTKSRQHKSRAAWAQARQ